MSNRNKIKAEDIQLYADKAGLKPLVIVMLHAAFGNSYVHLAKEFNIPLGTVRSRLSRARASIMKVKNDEGTSTPGH